MNDSSTNDQIETLDAGKTQDTNEQKIDHAADSMASKGIRLEHKHENERTPGGVSGVDGGLFTK